MKILGAMKELMHSSVIRLILLLIVFLIPIDAFSLSMTGRTLEKDRQLVIDGAEDALAMSMSQVDYTLSQMQTNMQQLVTNDTDYALLAYKTPQTDNEIQSERQAIVRLGLTLNNVASLYPALEAVYTYFPQKDYFVTSQGNGSNRGGYKGYAQTLYELYARDNALPVRKWVVDRINGRLLLFYFSTYRGNCYGAWVDVAQLQTEMGFPVSENLLFFSGTEHGVASGIDEELFAGDYLTEDSVTYDGIPYQVVRASSRLSDLTLTELLPQQEFNRSFRSLMVLRTLAWAGLLSIPIFLIGLYFWVADPVNKLLAAMSRVQEGDLDARVEDISGKGEFRRLGDAFNEMITQAKSLKIQVYERELERNQIRMRYLSSQIRPHFILNAMNVIYSYGPQEYPLIQKMVLYLSRYFRYIIKTDSEFVYLFQELNHIGNYLEIQQARFPDKLRFSISCDPTMERCVVPPLLVQTFAENAVKYALKATSIMTVQITASPWQDDRLCIVIENDGSAISEEILRQFETFKRTHIPQKDLGIGFQNSVDRLSLLYENEADLQIGHKENGEGTAVRIILPQRFEELED